VSLAAVGAIAAALAGGAPQADAVAPTQRHPIVVGDERISRGWLRHWADVVMRSGGSDREDARFQAAGLLISFRWIVNEAAERGIVVTRAETSRAFRSQRDAAFPRRRDYRRFLRDSGQTPTDVRARVRIDLFAQKLRETATAGAVSPEEQQAMLDEFVQEFRRKWRRRTACHRPWVNRFSCGERVGPRGAAG
jgi:hypothetical protein